MARSLMISKMEKYNLLYYVLNILSLLLYTLFFCNILTRE